MANTVPPGDHIAVRFSKQERNTVLDLLLSWKEITEDFQGTPPEQAVTLSANQWESLSAVLSFFMMSASHPSDQQNLRSICTKIHQSLALLGIDSVDPVQLLEFSDMIGEALDSVDGPLAEEIDPEFGAGGLYYLSLTQRQREVIDKHTAVAVLIKAQLAQIDKGTHEFLFTIEQLDHMADEIEAAYDELPKSEKRILTTVKNNILDIRNEIEYFSDNNSWNVIGHIPDSNGPQPEPDPELLLQFKVTLLHFKPPIWRRIVVPDGTLADLHSHIQTAFGWQNSHLHQFEIEGERYSAVFEGSFQMDDDNSIDESTVLMSQLRPNSKEAKPWRYEYDFGDGWEHEILFEGTPPRDPQKQYPLCRDGRRACPPEDSGGPFGFPQLLQDIADPHHPNQEELAEWLGPFDPEEFDAEQASQEMRQGLRAW